MRIRSQLSAVCLLLASLASPFTWAGKQTVCTITINSADEQKTFRRFLPQDKYDFVELVERGRKDWLRSSCEAKVSCDVLIISGHHGEGNVFFSDALDIRDNLPIAELERVACSDSCPSLFANLKEVYLFGCNTLASQPQHTIGAEIARSFERDGRPRGDAARMSRALTVERGESSRDRMRLVFGNVPVIYGFASTAPLGPYAASSLNRYFQSAGAGEVGKGRASSRLLQQFAANHMVATRGMSSGDALTGLRRDVCTFADERKSESQRLASVHELLQRTADARLLLDRVEGFTATLDDAARKQPEVAAELDRIAQDSKARERWMAFARDADEPQTRARMIDVAQQVGWLSKDQRRDEIAAAMGDLLARKEVSATDVELACNVNSKHELDGLAASLGAKAPGPRSVGQAALLACMGDTASREQVLKAWVSPSDRDVQIAQAYLRHQPITDASELRVITREIAGMNSSDAQARALDTLGRMYVSDRESVDTLKQLYASTRSLRVQDAIAGVLIRADLKALAPKELLPTLREHRLKPSPKDNMVDALIGRLQESS